MRKLTLISLLTLSIATLVAFEKSDEAINLRKIYSKPISEWPAPFIDSGTVWKELTVLPASPIEKMMDSLKHQVALGKILFFDNRLSGSGQIACASCHLPSLSWTDGKAKSLGHEGTINKRNSPTIQNSWALDKLFWDGRSTSLEDQAFAPINSESEMHGDIRELPRNLRKIKGYGPLFDSAFGDPGIDPDRIATALAMFQRTIVSRRSKFDEFVSGNKYALNKSELKGLHLFRTKARCMNCHHGALFTDNKFHNNGFHLNGDPKNDPGRYNVTHNDSDIGKFKTPSLRDVMFTGPWMHNGGENSMESIISRYNYGSPDNPALRKLVLYKKEQEDLLAFLKAISSPPLEFNKPVMPE